MSKPLKNKDETMTIRVRKAVKEQALVLYEKAGTTATLASFLGDMVILGLKVTEITCEQQNSAVKTVVKAGNESLQVSEPAPSYGTEIKVVRPREFDNNVAAISDSAVYIPFYGQAAAGKPIDISISPDLVVPWSKEMIKGDAGRYFSIWIKGNSMTEAGIQDGDYVLLKRADTPKHNKIMLIRHGNESTLKRIKMKGDQEVYMCWEDGSGKEPVRIDDQDYEIQGEYIGFMRG